jgi:hypothetical protein
VVVQTTDSLDALKPHEAPAAVENASSNNAPLNVM